MNKRLGYIDALRGFTMILVVFAHVECFGYGFDFKSFLGELFQSFRMPLFFFVSGYVGAKALLEDFRWTVVGKRLRVQIVPTLCFGLIYTYVVLHADVHFFVYNPAKAGYWFTIALLEMFLICHAVQYATGLFLKRNKELCSIGVMICLAVLFCLLRLPLKVVPLLKGIGDISCLHFTFDYFQFFVAGIIATHYKQKFVNLLSDRCVTGIMIGLFAILFYVKYEIVGSMDLSNVSVTKILFELLTMGCGYTGIWIVFNCFRIYESSFSADIKVGKWLQYIGRHTLDIYLLHYFLLPSLPEVGTFLEEKPNAVIELCIGVTFALLIIALCLVISKVLRSSKIIAYWLFGAKSIKQ